MKQVMAIIRINRINATKKALNDVGITSFTATGRVLGRGKAVSYTHLTLPTKRIV